ncbi:zinc finger protein 521 isoform X1 [Diabrotica virgifera virgifera]|uniref:Zinc finger protein 521-like isoform X1 n=1 Tax=Diabrotica virgifera virgifera TaxID=50390 RepID=A0A6P7F5D5_DIAVI|nr:zinc finger protein 521 isoform X1 [Diabrotica virgifera virgifera]
MAEAENIDFQACCRLCLSEMVDSLKSIFDETPEDESLSEKILQSVAIEVSSADKLSTKICKECVEKVTDWSSYKERCLQNQKKLTELLVAKEGPEVLVVPEIIPEPDAPLPVNGIESETPSDDDIHENQVDPASLLDLSLQIKEEPADHTEQNEHDNPNMLDMGQMNHHQLDQPNDMIPGHVMVKSEPVDMDGLDEVYSEFPPQLSPQQVETDDLNQPLVVSVPANNRTCGVCGKLFSSAGNKRKHEKMQHGLHNNISVVTPITSDALTNGEVHQEPNSDQQKILFAMGLKLLQTSATPISSEELSKIEISYIEKCKAMVNMHKSLTCACHNVPHQNLKGLLSHLRALRIWFPVFTCYNCMITFTDRSTFTRHISRCQSSPLDSITKLSNLKHRSEVKTRLYQNFKCTICKFMFSFHEDFCTHVDLDHSMLQFPVHCPCGRIFENMEDYKDHVYVSCLVDFYCDICFVTTKTLDDFQKHAKEVHDDSEGFILLQDDNYKVRKPSMHVSPSVIDEGVILTGKRERKSSYRFVEDELDEVIPLDSNTNLYTPRTNNRSCPICTKEYSSYKNMMRHYKTHRPEEIEEHRQQQQFDYDSQDMQDMDLEDEESMYSCPDCGGMFKSLEWKIHLTEQHQQKPCGECGKFFQFQTELDQHRTTHLNLKISRDSKTQSYTSTMISPGGEDDVEGGEEPGDRVFACEVCEFVFSTQDELMNHKLEQDHGELEPMDNVDGMENMDDNMDLEVMEPLQTMEILEPQIETTSKKSKCDVCDQEFNNYNGLWEHNRSKHPERKTPHVDTYPKKCKECDKVCTTGAAYYRHIQIHSKVPADAGANKMTLLKPKKEIEEESYHTCKRCFKVFSSKYNLKNHLKCHGININPVAKKMVRKAVCRVCQQVFETNEELIRHKQDHHNSVETPYDNGDRSSLVFPCDVCVMTFGSKIALKKHKDKHILESKPPSRSVFCKYCKIPFDTYAALSLHMSREHDERGKKQIKEVYKPEEYSCTICGKSFQSAGALTTHIGWHKRAQNDGTGKLLKHVPPAKPKLLKVQPIQIKEEPSDEPRHQCSTCLAELPNDTALQVHILEKHRSVSAIMLIPRCNTCNKDFTTQDEYETHKRLHDFLERQKQHEQKMLIQQQDGPQSKMAPNKPKFPCKYCNAAFSRSDTLGGHIRQYHKEHVQTEFRCNQCDRVFEKQNSLTIHLKTHDKQRSFPNPASQSKPMFSCSICNMGFDLPKDLRTHTITAHPF